MNKRERERAYNAHVTACDAPSDMWIYHKATIYGNTSRTDTCQHVDAGRMPGREATRVGSRDVLNKRRNEVGCRPLWSATRKLI